MQKNSTRDIVTIGLALFAMFFGAGNLIFAPFLGMETGSSWISGAFFFCITGVGLVLLTLIGTIKAGGNAIEMCSVVGKLPAEIIVFLVVTCQVCGSFPRTCALSYELLMLPIAPNFPLWLFSIIYFGIVVFVSFSKTRAVDIIGKILTPALLVGMAVLIIYGVANPIGTASGEPLVDNVVREGLEQGYQAMDVLGAMLFPGVIIAAAYAKGYKTSDEQVRITVKSSLVAVIILVVVYFGLTYLGASASSVLDRNLSNAPLLTAITSGLFGKPGAVLLGIIVCLACMTTAIGLISAFAQHYTNMCHEKIEYKYWLIIVAVIGMLIANIGLSKIISIASPILALVYPMCVMTVVFYLLKNKITNLNIAKGCVLMITIFGVLNMIDGLGISISFIHALPLYGFGLYWVVPGLIGGIVGAFIKPKKDIVAN